MKYLLWPFRIIYCLYAYAWFVAIMLLIFPFVLAASFMGRVRGGNIIMWLCRLWSDLWFPLCFIFTKRIVVATNDKNKSYIFVSNHISYLDAAILPKSIRQSFRPLGKVEISKVPIFGFIYSNAIVTVDRSSAANRAASVKYLISFLKKGMSVSVFPEGTFNMTNQPTKDFFDGAFRIAIETQTPIKPVLYLDTYRRLSFESVWSLTPGINRILYLPEIATEGYTLKELPILKQKVKDLMDENLIRYNAGWRK